MRTESQVLASRRWARGGTDAVHSGRDLPSAPAGPFGRFQSKARLPPAARAVQPADGDSWVRLQPGGQLCDFPAAAGERNRAGTRIQHPAGKATKHPAAGYRGSLVLLK